MAHQAGPRACLSTYPPDVTMMGQDPGVLTLCESYWNERGLLVFRASVPLPPRAAPRPIGFAAAGFMFCPATILADVPFGALPSAAMRVGVHRWAAPHARGTRAAPALPARTVSAVAGERGRAGGAVAGALTAATARADPELPMLFSGEEILFSARLWTAGYDVFAPGANVVFHLYSTSASTRPKFWEVRAGLGSRERVTAFHVPFANAAFHLYSTSACTRPKFREVG